MKLADRIEQTEPEFWETVPFCRKAGRYCFFVLCAFSVGLLFYGVGREIGFVSDIARLLSAISMIATFLALRDMSSQWDAVMFAQAAAIRAQEAGE